jgi:esterase
VLAHSIVTPKSGDPERYMLFLHGILGTRANWRRIARRFVDARPAWGAVLVDLRQHGDSLDFPAPHTLAAAASDVRKLEEALGLRVEGALGHSFGGKVVLRWLADRPGQPTQAWVIDASPSSRRSDRDATATAAVLEMLSRLPSQWPSREAFVSAVTDAGQPAAIAEWLAMNLRRSEDGSRRFGPDLRAIRDLIDDYARTDLWEVVESLPRSATLDFVIGGRSKVWSEADRARIDEISQENPRVSVHLFPDAGHWIHVDTPDALLALLTSTSRPTR